MSETAEQVSAREEQEAIAAFKSGYSGTNEPLEDQAEDEHADTSHAEPVDVPPEYVQMTKQQFDDMQNRLGEIDNLKTAHAKTSGSIGTLNQVIEQLRATTAPGKAVDLSADVVDGLKDQFGDELSGAVLDVLRKAAPALRGTGTAFDPASLDAKFAETSTRIRSSVKTEILQDMLTDAHPDWVTVRDTQEFKDWKTKLPENVRKTLDTTNSVAYLSGKLTEFKGSLKKKQDAATSGANRQQQAAARGDARRQTMQAAVQPRSDGGNPPAKNANDDFHDGFNKIAGKR